MEAILSCGELRIILVEGFTQKWDLLPHEESLEMVAWSAFSLRARPKSRREWQVVYTTSLSSLLVMRQLTSVKSITEPKITNNSLFRPSHSVDASSLIAGRRCEAASIGAVVDHGLVEPRALELQPLVSLSVVDEAMRTSPRPCSPNCRS